MADLNIVKYQKVLVRMENEIQRRGIRPGVSIKVGNRWSAAANKISRRRLFSLGAGSRV